MPATLKLPSDVFGYNRQTFLKPSHPEFEFQPRLGLETTAADSVEAEIYLNSSPTVATADSSPPTLQDAQQPLQDAASALRSLKAVPTAAKEPKERHDSLSSAGKASRALLEIESVLGRDEADKVFLAAFRSSFPPTP